MGYDILHRDSHWRQPVRKKVLINFTKFTGKPMCHSLFFLFFVFSCEFYKISKNIFFTEHLQVTVTACKKQIEKQPPEVCNKILVPHEIGELIFYYSCSIKKAVLKNLAIFTGKHQRWSLSLINLQAFSLQVFSCEYCKIFKKTYFEEHLRTTASEDCYVRRFSFTFLRIGKMTFFQKSGLIGNVN